MNWAQRLQAIAQTGLTYCHDQFDQERFEAIREIAAEIMAEGSGAAGWEPIVELFKGDTGYATPKIDVRAAVFDQDRVLLVREREDGRWTLPGGWADVGVAPSVNVLREVKEESGYDAEIVKLAAVYDRNLHGHPPFPFHAYKMFFLARLTGGTATLSGETDGVGFFGEDEIPPLSLTRVVPSQIRQMFEHYRNPGLPVACD